LVAIAIAAVVGLSRIYLRVHYWSDVAAGWGLGAGIFATLTAIVLVVEYMRQNGRDRETGPPDRPLARVEQ
jgi:Na+/glutamate symporter